MKHIKRPLRAHFLRLLFLAAMLAFSNVAIAGAASPISEPGPNFRDLQHLEDTTHQRIQELKGIVAAQDEKTWLRIQGFEKQIESQQQAINHVMSQADWMSIFIMTALVALGFTTFFSSRKQAREAVRTWVEKNKDEVLGQLKDKMQSAIDESVRTLEVEIIKKVKLDDLLERTAQKLAEKGDAAFTLNDKAALNRAAKEADSIPLGERSYRDWESLATAEYSKENFEESAKYFISVSKSEDATAIQKATSLFNAGVALGKVEKWEESLQVIDILEKRFGSIEDLDLIEIIMAASLNKSIALIEIGKLGEALATYDDLVKRIDSYEDPSMRRHLASAYNGQAYIHICHAKNLLQSIAGEKTGVELLTRANYSVDASLKIQPDNADALANKGYILFLLSREDEAKQLLLRALKLGGEKLRDAELEGVGTYPLPQDEVFKELINKLWDEIQSEKAEKSLIGAIFANNKAYEEVSEFLNPEHFFIAQHRIIYDACDVSPEFPPFIGRARFQNIALYGRFDQADMGHAPDVSPEFPPFIGRARFQNIALYGRFDQADMGHAPYRLFRRTRPASPRHGRSVAGDDCNHASTLPIRPWRGTTMRTASHSGTHHAGVR